jgi:uncharacterized protein YunC (DUF1805 family)
MADETLPQAITRPLQFEEGAAVGISHRWGNGQYCAILTRSGLVGCGIYDVVTAGKFGQVVAIARGTPQHPLVNPEDLLEAKIVDISEPARQLGLETGITGREAIARLLAADAASAAESNS